MIIRELAGPIALRGRGLHNGRWCQVRMLPAPPGAGLTFVVDDVSIPATLDRVVGTSRRTVLGSGRTTVSTVEHLMAALSATGIWDAVIRVDGGEVPAGDGSAAPFVAALLRGSRSVEREVPSWCVIRPFSWRQGRRTCHFLPGAPTIECAIRFPHPLVGIQHVRLGPSRSVRHFQSRFARARTFGFLDEASGLRRLGMARGASLHNVVVMDRNGVLNPGGLRYADEPARHKLIDVLGDLALLGGPFAGRVRLDSPGHRLVVDALRRAVVDGHIGVPEITDPKTVSRHDVRHVESHMV